MHKHKPLFSPSRRRFLHCAGASGLLLPTTSLFAQDAYVEATTRFGRVRGRQLNGVNVFKGVPYGADTGGANRFMPPRDPTPWREYRDAFEYGPAAPQSDPASGRQQDGNESEDCLVLNVWTRGLNDGGKRPVMFWCHGGGFTTLSGSSPGYDGTNLCLRGDVVVVTINHRLNMLGFTHFGDLGGEDFAESGTVGMLDIVHALTWVRDNIEQFGGDPERVMIFGESGGGRKVATLLGMPAAKGLFHAAVIQSGATLQLPSREQGTVMAQRLLDNLSIDRANLRRIQEVPITRLMAAYVAATSEPGPGGFNFSPTVNGDDIPYSPFYPVASPVNPGVPVIIGANRTEMSYFGAPADYTLDEAGMIARVRAIVGEDRLSDVLGVYREANPDASPTELHFLIYSDARYVMPSITIAERRSALSPTYLYYLTWETAETARGMLSPHTLDIPFIFDNEDRHPFTAGRPGAEELAAQLSSSIINFARTGDPNAGMLPTWETYTPESRATMVLNSPSSLVYDPIARQREVMQPLLML